MSKNKRLVFLGILMILMIFLTACSNQADSNKVEDNAFLMDTLVKVRAHGDGAEKAVEESINRIKEIEKLMSKTIKSSDVYKLNNNPQTEIEINSETMIVLKKAKEYAELTNGDFDPTLGALVNLWGIGTENPTVPKASAIKKALKNSGYQYLELNQGSAKLKRPKVKLDLGGIVKGYAADSVKEIMKKNEVEHAFVNLGGNVLVIGDKVDGSAWKIGIQDPRLGRGNVMAIVNAKDMTIVTSGNYERYFEKNGKLYHHIIDPKTGYPAENNLLSVSIISRSSFDADALSTSIYVMGLEKGINFIENMDQVEAMFITKDLDVYLSSGLNKIVEIKNKDFNLIEGEHFAN